MEKAFIEKYLEAMGGEYAFYYQKGKELPLILTNQEEDHRFLTASVIKVPILLAWMALEKQGRVSSDEICDFADEPQVEGAGFSYLFRTRKLAFADVLVMMIATSDNFCTNLVIRRLGFELLNQTFSEDLKLRDTHIGRKMMSKPDYAGGKDNWTTCADMARCFELCEALDAQQRQFVRERLLVCESEKLFLRDFAGDSIDFYHKSGGLSNVINEWGFTERTRIFLLCNNYPDYRKVYQAFGVLGSTLLK